MTLFSVKKIKINCHYTHVLIHFILINKYTQFINAIHIVNFKRVSYFLFLRNIV